VQYPAAYPGVLSVGATDTQAGGFCSFSNRGEGLRLLAPGCDLDGADPTSGASNYNYWQGTSEASAIAAGALGALYAYQPAVPLEAGERALTEADGGVLDITGAFRRAGLEAVVAAGEAAEPKPTQSSDTSTNTGASSPQPVPPLIAMSVMPPFAQPHARLKRAKHRLVLVLSGRPHEAQVQVRCFGRSGRARRLHVLRNLDGVFTSLTLPASVVEVAVRFIDLYDIERASEWTTLRVPVSGGKVRKARRSR
jgi:hypothetical protein